MEARELQGCDSDGGFNTLVCQEDFRDDELKTYSQSNQNKLQVSLFSMSQGRSCRLTAGILMLLAAVLLIVDISLGVHYNKLTDTHLILEDTERIGKELGELQGTYKTAIEAMKGAHMQLDSEMSRQQQTNWEVEHQKKRSQDYVVQIDTVTKDIANLKTHLPKITDGCKHCPVGWFLTSSVCYYFSSPDRDGRKTWQKAQEFCQIQGGDLLIIDSKDKENATVSHLLNHQVNEAFWIGLKDSQEEGTWKWVDGTELDETYWRDGEPNDAQYDEDCAGIIPEINFFKAWNDMNCKVVLNFICEKAQTS
ncbi:CD209 antigen-like protein E [Austrofundulus limnaeus]|uniref:CD209 antigen-like protein E n=1 Tax=Austrofundulus limnaeus TaxID=52670 RepID=A0A2I4BKH8_AUSLI|nr:PREDICTED: CD209 antigen-like protein E [Austrofundulus limnaeus]XP_013868248.1 PREDICTED: CD209 antigen-like protein E [Austrofundulus limnaeus]